MFDIVFQAIGSSVIVVPIDDIPMNSMIKLVMAFAGLVPTGYRHAQKPPSFEQFAHTNSHTNSAALRIPRQRDAQFRTELNEASKRPINFAGHYVLTTIGCGASCIHVAAVDAKTGRVTWLPFTLCCWESSIPEPVLFRLDSELLILKGQRDEVGGSGPHYFRLLGGHFVELPAPGNKTGSVRKR